VSGPRFLIIKIAALGDIAVTTALLSRIRADHPDAVVTWLCGEAGRSLVELFEGVDEIITVNDRRVFRGSLFERAAAVFGVWIKLAGRRFEHVLLVHADARFRVLVWPLVWTSRISMLKHGVNPLLGRFRGDEYARLLDGNASSGPIVRSHPLADVRPNLPAPIAHDSPVVVLVPGGARNILREDWMRRWPIECYRELATRLIDSGVQVDLVGDSGDVAASQQFLGLALRDHIGRLSINETLRVLRDADVVVSHDTGPLHFARLVRTPAVALFGPTEPRNMLGADPDIDVLWGGEHLPCRPCYDGRNYAECSNNLCMRDISVESVFAAVQNRLMRVRSSRRLPVNA
jgi:heptosyltransferase-2